MARPDGQSAAGRKQASAKWSALALLRRASREPLTHFLGIAAILFFGLAAYERPVDAIEIDRARLVQFMQERARIFDDATFSALYDRLTPAERAELVHEYAMSEALYRTAEASSLDRTDPLIRQRMIQQMRLLLQDQASAQLTISDKEVRAHFERHRQDYVQPATLSFTHVFVDRRKHGDETGRMARDLLGTLRQRRVTFEQAGNFGDLFPYRRNYLDVSRQQVGGELGEAVAEPLFSSQTTTGQWQGPFQSDLGDHLVLISSRRAGRIPELAEVEEKVREDALFAKRELATSKVADRMLGAFRLRLAEDVGEVAERTR